MNILLGVCGSIAAYKSLDICRDFINKGHNVIVVLTQGALQFVRPEVFSYLGATQVYTHNEDFLAPGTVSVEKRGPVLHITLANWCDRMVLSPLSANTLAKLNSGEACDLLTSIYLSLGGKPLILYPAMNTKMLNHPMTQRNLHNLSQLPNVFIYPADSGTLACGEMGEGKLPPVECITETAPIIVPQKAPKGKSVLISAGATISPLDPIRYFTNPSSGKTGYLLAKAYLARGHKVTVITGKMATSLFEYLLPLPNFTLKRIVTSQDMEKEVLHYFPQSDIFISSAAVCDIEFEPAAEKMKKENLEGSLPFKKTTDILAKTLTMKSQGQVVVGFAAETRPTEEVFFEKWQRKPVDLLVGNVVHNGMTSQGKGPMGFGTEEGNYFFVKKGKITQNKNLSKEELSEEIYQWTMEYGNH